MTTPIFILNGPNLNLLGEREPDIYGHDRLSDIEARCKALADEVGHGLRFEQSNHEGQLVDWIHEARGASCGLIINAGAFTHSSVALLDAILAYDKPVIELHISNIYRREAFRHQSYLSQGATAVMCGFGVSGYELAIRGLIQLVQEVQA